MDELECRVNLHDQVIERLMLIIAVTATPEQLESLSELDRQWLKTMKEIESGEISDKID